jgi:two-component system response regulator HydG
MAEVERQHILRVLAATDGNRTEAARILGLDRKTLYRKLLEYSKSAKSPICWRED